MPSPITVAIPTYNRRDGVAALARSILSQMRAGDELVVSDDGSTDGTADALSNIAGVSVVRQPSNLGMVGNWNFCLTAGTNDWVCLIHDDDRLLPGGLDVLRRACDLVGGPGLVGHADWYRAVHPVDGGFCYTRREPGRFAALNAELCPSGVAIHRAVPAAVGTFDSVFPYSADMEYFARVCANFPSVVVLNPGTIEYVIGGDNYQLKTWRKPDFFPQLRAVEAASIGHAKLPPAEHDALLHQRLRRDLSHILHSARMSGDRDLTRWAARRLLEASDVTRSQRLRLRLTAVLGRSPLRLFS